MTSYWHIEVITNQRTIDWQNQGDALIEYFRQEMPFHVIQTPWVLPGREEIIEQGQSNGHCLYTETGSTKLVLAFLNEGDIKLFIELTEQPTHTDQLEPWFSAINRAHERLSEEEPEYKWVSAIGYRPGIISDSPKLTEEMSVGTITVKATERPHTEAREEIETPHLGGASIISSFPLITLGRSRGYNWDAAKRQALSDLNSICALFSLQYDCYWYVRMIPHTAANEALELPEWGLGFQQLGSEPVLGNTREVEAPSWMASAWNSMESSNMLNSAVHAHRQGLLLANEAPSLSLVCFVSAIEIIGSSLEEVPTCQACGSHPGAARRFRLALKTTHSRKEVTELSKTYDFRSQTAHAGILHGGEKSWGGISMHMSAFSSLPEDKKFRYQTLRKIQEASKKVIVHQILSEGVQ